MHLRYNNSTYEKMNFYAIVHLQFKVSIDDQAADQQLITGKEINRIFFIIFCFDTKEQLIAKKECR